MRIWFYCSLLIGPYRHAPVCQSAEHGRTRRDLARARCKMGGVPRAHMILSMHQTTLGTYIDPICIQYVRARPNFWSALRSADNFLVCAVAMLGKSDPCKEMTKLKLLIH